MNRFLVVILFVITPIFMVGQEDNAVKVYYENTETSITIYADNESTFPRSVKLDLNLKGFKQKGAAKKYFYVPANSKKLTLVELERTGNGEVSFGYKYTIYMGQINAKHDNNFAYTLPFRSNDSFELTQGYYGKFSHQNKEALDFTMPIGTEIVAARSGKVIDVKENSNLGCAEQKCLESANYLTILHDDGSFAQYFHLRKNGVEVSLSQIVSQGELIGYSGNTGFTSGAHLHFEVNISTVNGIETVPTTFRINGKKRKLEVGDFYNSENNQ